ncbi:hypothetical protein OG352_05975 [Streptomyces sp. NBC_01485]|uniref:hypothetical protein n=1 Tax=Streptomyces sp. NBC_01485 TaxID=2903884 RepID=UPI002E2EA394|nr:hypothetical protein [Streptomyces sp. NBC_01485]
MKYQIEGPFPLTLNVTEGGAELGVARFLKAVFLDLFNAADSDPEGFGEELAEMHALAQSAQCRGRDSHARHDFDERMGRMLDKFTGDGQIELYATGLTQLRDALNEVLKPREIPAQRESGTAA